MQSVPVPAPAQSIGVKRIFDIALQIFAGAIVVGLIVSSFSNVSKAWDVWSYHLPFAARIAGIVGPDTYVFGSDNQHRYEGFPLLAEALQGIVWRITGKPETASFVSLAGLFALPWFLRRAYRVPAHLSLLALLAVPLVQIHATAAYIDLPANACLALLFLGVHRALVKREAPPVSFLVVSAGLAAATANMKFQLVPLVVLASVVLLVRVVQTRASAKDPKKLLLVFVLAFPIVFATPLKNCVKYGNPVWPIELSLLGRTLPHAEEAYASSPPHLENATRFERFTRSVLETDNRPIASHRRWSIDQWTPHDEPGYRMGGFFGRYVVVNLAALALAVWRRRSREAYAAGGMFAGLTVAVALMPQSHELRYYMGWMLVLVALNLVLWAREARAATGLIAAGALGVVIWATSGWYLYPAGDSFRALVEQKVDLRVIEEAQPGEHLCIAREPWTFLYAASFHPGKSYVVHEAAREEDCASTRKIP